MRRRTNTAHRIASSTFGIVRTSVACLAFVIGACNPKPHVRLGPLPPDLTAGQRVQTYNELHATFEQETTTRTCSGRGGCSTTIERTLMLANGTRVHHAEDLLPVVSPDSPAAKSVNASLRAERSRRNFTLLGLAGIALFAVVGSSVMSDEDGDVGSGAKLGLLVGGGAVLVGAFGAWHYYYKASDEHALANEQYNEGLARQLRVCVDGLFVTPCEAASQTAPNALRLDDARAR